MKITNPHHHIYTKACAREAQFWIWADDYANIEIPARVTIYENKKRTGSATSDEFDFLKSLGTFSQGLSLGSWGGTYELRLMLEWIVDRFVFIDISEWALTTLKHNAEKLGLSDRIETRVQDFNFLELPENTYDLVSCQNMLHHIVNLEESLHAINRSLTQDGIFVTNECISESKMYWTDTKMSMIATISTLLQEKGIETKEFIRTNPRVLTNNCPFECVRSDELYAIIDHYFWEKAIRHVAYGPIQPHWNAISDDRSDEFFDILESFDAFAEKYGYVLPNRLYGIYKKTDAPLLVSRPRSEKEMQEHIGVTAINERALMSWAEKIQKKFPALYNTLKRLYFKIR